MIVVSVRQQSQKDPCVHGRWAWIRQQRSLIVKSARPLPRRADEFFDDAQIIEVDVRASTTPVLKERAVSVHYRQSIRWMMIGVGRLRTSGLRGESSARSEGNQHMLP